MVSFFKPIKKDHEGMKEILRQREASKLALQKIQTKVIERKEKLFKQKDVSKWELSEENQKLQGELMSNKEKAFDAMLPKETDEVTQAKEQFLFFSNQCYFELKRQNNDQFIDMKDMMVGFASLQKKLSSIVRKIYNSQMIEKWTMFENEPLISAEEEEQALTENAHYVEDDQIHIRSSEIKAESERY